MIKEITNGYKKLLLSTLKTLLLILLCGITGALFVIPLWSLAVKNSALYSVLVSVIFALLLIYYLYKKIKNQGFLTFLINFLKIVIIAGGIVFCFYLVLNNKRLFTLPVIAGMILLYGFLSFGLKKSNDR